MCCCRYTDGEYHHPKSVKIDCCPAGAKIAPSVAKIAKQRSIGSIGTDSPGVDSVSINEGVGETTPMLSLVKEELNTPLVRGNPHRTEVAVEVHRDPSNGVNSGHSKNAVGGGGCVVNRRTYSSPRPLPIKSTSLVPRLWHNTRQSLSLDVVNAHTHRWGPVDKRRAKSYEAGPYRPPPAYNIPPRDNYDRLEITQFSRGPFYSADFDLMSEDGSSEVKSTVRYNDTGSYEEVNEAHLFSDSPNMEAGYIPTVNGGRKYRDLWSLRRTFEEEEDFSDTIRMEDMSPEEHSAEDREQAASYTTSFESNTEVVTEGEQSSEQHSSEDTVIRNATSDLLGPGYENRRQTYCSILSKRLHRSEPPTSADNSFDSVETIETDGDASESSRHEMTTTSFESTTDNTDSTGDSQAHKLQQMRGDSGYKSLETQNSQQQQQVTPPRCSKKQIHFALDHESIEKDGSKSVAKIFSDEPVYTRHSVEAPETYGRRHSKKFVRNGRTASKKRREYRAERQVIHVRESTIEPDTDSRSDQPSGDSFEESQTSRKQSLFSRFLRRHSTDSNKRQLSRDYSVDEKTDALFNEFTRHDPALEQKGASTVSMRRISQRLPAARPKLHRKQTDPTSGTSSVYHDRCERLSPSMRSASLGSDSSAGSLPRRLSPQDSIEEEYLKTENSKTWRSCRRPASLEKTDYRIHDVPIICLPEEGSADH